MGTPAMVLPELGKDYAFKHARRSFRHFFDRKLPDFQTSITPSRFQTGLLILQNFTTNHRAAASSSDTR
ncbi:hypothetical protein AD944_15190 [Acetobacter tropicalis]|nr:hypothetical protein AD944_15190 [Acetobacter tropicalis]